MALELNQDKVIKIVSEIETSLQRLEELRRLPEDTFCSDPHKVASAKYQFIVAIEGMIDLCNHIIAKNHFRAPEDYADAFRVLSEKGAFEAGFTQTLVQMTRFRNRLVHLYWAVDDDELYRILLGGLDDIRMFLKRFGSFISQEDKKTPPF